MKNYNKIFCLGIFICFFISSFTIEGRSQFADLNFEFNKDILYDSDNIEFEETFNIRNQSFYNGTYPATYSFTDDDNGAKGINISFVDLDTILSTEVISNYLGHNKILYFNTSIDENVFNYFDNPQTFGFVEYWMNNAIEQDFYIILYDDEGHGCTYTRYTSHTNIRILSGNGVGGSDETDVSVEPDSWNHIKVDFNCESDNYSVWINDILKLDNKPFASDETATTLNYFRIFSADTCEGYLDAIGYSWDINYNYYDTYTFQEFVKDSEFNTTTTPYESWAYEKVNPPSTQAFIPTLDGIEGNYLRLLDDNATAKVLVGETFESTSLAVISFYFRRLVNDARENFQIKGDGGLTIISFAILENDLTDIINTIDYGVISLDVWYFILFELNASSDTYNLYIDGIFKGTSDFSFNTDLIGGITFFTSNAPIITYAFDIDSVGVGSYSIGYFVGDNRYPILEINEGIFEVNRDEFALEGIDNLYDIGEPIPETWLTAKDGAGIVDIALDLVENDVNDRMVRLVVAGAGDIAGIQKRDFNLTENFIGIEIGFGLVLGDSAGSKIFFSFVAEGQIITEFIINYTDTSLYWNNGTIHQIRDDLVLSKYYEMKLLLNYEWNLVFMDFYIDKVFNESYSFDLIESDKSGLEVIDIALAYFTGSSHVVGIDYIGVYADGKPQTEELGWSTIDLGLNSWSQHEHNLIEKIAFGYMHFGVSEGQYFVEVSLTSLIPIRQYTNNLTIYNAFDSGGNKTNPIVILTVKNSFNISSLHIEGIKLNEGVNEYTPELTNGGILKNESYFYVDSNHKLQFNHISDDSGVEFIQISFDIIDRNSNSSTLGWSSRRDNNAYGYFRISYEIDSAVYEIAPYIRSRKFLLPENRVIDKLVMLVSDRGFSIDGLTTGYFSDISIQYSADIIISVITLNLIGMIIPLIIILAPTLAISEAYGKDMIIPMFILMSIILVVSGFIPLWLFFVIVIASSMFIFRNKNVRNVI